MALQVMSDEHMKGGKKNCVEKRCMHFFADRREINLIRRAVLTWHIILSMCLWNQSRPVTLPTAGSGASEKKSNKGEKTVGRLRCLTCEPRSTFPGSYKVLLDVSLTTVNPSKALYWEVEPCLTAALMLPQQQFQDEARLTDNISWAYLRDQFRVKIDLFQ